MALTEKQDIPNRPEVREPWTFKRLFPFAGAVTSIAKAFNNPFDALLGYLILILGVAELIGRSVSWFFQALIVLVLLANVLERHNFLFEKVLKENKE